MNTVVRLPAGSHARLYACVYTHVGTHVSHAAPRTFRTLLLSGSAQWPLPLVSPAGHNYIELSGSAKWPLPSLPRALLQTCKVEQAGGHALRHVCQHGCSRVLATIFICIDLCVGMGMCIHMHTDMLADTFADISTVMCPVTCTDVCADQCTDMCAGTCADTLHTKHDVHFALGHAVLARQEPDRSDPLRRCVIASGWGYPGPLARRIAAATRRVRTHVVDVQTGASRYVAAYVGDMRAG